MNLGTWKFKYLLKSQHEASREIEDLDKSKQTDNENPKWNINTNLQLVYRASPIKCHIKILIWCIHHRNVSVTLVTVALINCLSHLQQVVSCKECSCVKNIKVNDRQQCMEFDLKKYWNAYFNFNILSISKFTMHMSNWSECLQCVGPIEFEIIMFEYH
jgi:hypothetical protein